MSRLGKQPISIPKGVEVKFTDGVLEVKGPKGALTYKMRSDIGFAIQEDRILLMPKNDALLTKALWGTYHSILLNLIMGVTDGFTKKLVIEGIGYRAQMKEKDLELSLGFSHPVIVKAQEEVELSVDKNTITVSGTSKEKVGNVAASIRALKKPEPYKGKGIHYEGEVIRRKVGKKAAGTGT